ncbi:uncharacterized protein LOC121994059 [Zingiber officinale]|uniref:uncharacterized protein LOC121994059 n=1 Tax=Zingiber officinale TaxID=94328 RepID=UPI001C4B4461|nr:uncharacterized protein LOC121994059 [Zingiber officinale]
MKQQSRACQFLFKQISFHSPPTFKRYGGGGEGGHLGGNDSSRSGGGVLAAPSNYGVGGGCGRSSGWEDSGFEWELHKENVRPLKCDRNTKLLNRALKVQVDRDLKAPSSKLAGG